MNEIIKFLESLPPQGQAKVAGFLAAVAEEKAPADLQLHGYGSGADAFSDAELLPHYRRGHELGEAFVLSAP